MGGGAQNGGGVGQEAHLPHKNTKNTSTSGITDTEHLPKASRRPHSQRARKPPHNWVGQKESEQSLHPKDRAVKEERSLLPGKSFH